jgi:poly(hydroxyalkanoate) depolymerase family esterase
MRAAINLTRQGRLDEATALIRAALSGQSSGPHPQPERPAPSILDILRPSSASAGGPSSSIRSALDALGRLGRRRGLGSPVTRQAPPALPEGARFEARIFASEAGSRSYKLFSPSGASGQAMPLVVMLHGCTQSADDFAAGTRMNDISEELKFLVAYPEQARSANSSKCWNWFNQADQERGGGEPSLIAGIADRIARDFAVDPGRIYVAGLSAGGAAAAVLGATYPDVFAAIGVHSGLACGAASDMPSAFMAMKQGAPSAASRKRRGGGVPTIVFHGDRDTTVNPANAAQVLAQSRSDAQLRRIVSTGEAGGKSYTRVVEAEANGRPVLEQWILHGGGHAWSGGSGAGSYTDPGGPDASREMIRFFLEHAKT